MNSQNGQFKRRSMIDGLSLALSVIAVLTLGTSALAETTPDNTVALSMPFESDGKWVIVPVEVDGSRPLRCILDTGMTEGLFIFDPALGEELNLSYVTTVPVGGVGEDTATADVAMGATLQLGSLSFEAQNLIVLTEASGLAQMGIDAVIGAAVFNRYISEIDFESSTLTLYEPEGFDASAAGEELELTVTATKPHVEATFSIDENTEISTTFLVDTGASGILVLFSSNLENLELPAEKISTVVSGGVGGDVHGYVGRVDEIEFGDIGFSEVVTAFQDHAPGAAGGVNGMGILRRFVVTFDYINGRMLLKPNESMDIPFEYNMAGLYLRPRAGGLLSVHTVIDDSPASRQDIQPGDLIVAIDGNELIDYAGSAVEDFLKDDGRTIAVIIERDGSRLEFELTLERMI